MDREEYDLDCRCGEKSGEQCAKACWHKDCACGSTSQAACAKGCDRDVGLEIPPA